MSSLDLRNSLGAVAIRRDVVSVEGPEALAFLQGQLSQEVETLAVGESAWSLLLQPNGKVDAWLRMSRAGDGRVLLDVEVGFGGAVLDRLQRFKLRTKAELALESREGTAVRGPGADQLAPTSALTVGWPGVEGFDVLDGTVIEAPDADSDALEALRVECGVPAMGAELTEATIPAEAGQWLVDVSVSFTKGCFTGQELVARIDSRGGKVPRPVRGLLVESDMVPIGSAVLAQGAEVGRVTSSAHSPALGAVALAPVARSVEVGSTVEVEAAGGGVATATVSTLPLL